MSFGKIHRVFIRGYQRGGGYVGANRGETHGQSEICTLLNKTQTNISAHRGHIRKKLGLNPEDNLRDVLTERMKQQGKLSGFTPPIANALSVTPNRTK